MINVYDIDQEAVYHNSSPNVALARQARSSLINNVPYHSGTRIHHLPTIQIDSRNKWDTLDLGFEVVPQYVANFLDHFDQGHENHFGELRVSLLRQENHETGYHDAFFLVHSIPHFQGIDGDIIQISYTSGSEREQLIRQFFDLSEYSIVLEMTEYQILEFLAHDDDAMYMLTNYFIYGFRSIRFDNQVPALQLQFYFDPEENEEYDEDQEEYMIPPPPIQNNIDLADLYFAEIANHPDILEQYDNIIPYWLENVDRFQQLINMQNVQG
jgi:hypothetical protein